MFDDLSQDRRRFLGAAARTMAAAQFGLLGAFAPSTVRTVTPARASPVRRGTTASFDPLKQVDAGLLTVGYAEDGPADGPAVLLLHGWPYDIHSFVEV
jgi:hypothetical protein